MVPCRFLPFNYNRKSGMCLWALVVFACYQFIGACKKPTVIVTELLLGGTLRKYLLNLRPRCLDIRLAVGFALDIARAMECLHSHGIIHRDLKPGMGLISFQWNVDTLIIQALRRLWPTTTLSSTLMGVISNLWLVGLCFCVSFSRYERRQYQCLHIFIFVVVTCLRKLMTMQNSSIDCYCLY